MKTLHENGFVRLDGCMADDVSVVNSARVSFGRRIENLEEGDKALIRFLMRERHGTPFEHNSFRFHISCPIFVAREWFRHRIGSFNEFSGRYSEMSQTAYSPSEFSWRRQAGKPGAYTFESINPAETAELTETLQSAYEASFKAYVKLLSMGVAKEQARLVIPVGTFTEFYWTVNARSLMNFLSLRTHETAQREIRDYAELVELLFAEQMPFTWEAWNANGKVSP